MVHRLHLECRPVLEIAERAKELGALSQDPAMKGTPNGELPKDMLPAVMIEKVSPDQEEVVHQKVVDLKVTRVVRCGNALHVQTPA